MRKRAYIVVGLGFGDEGKGSIVDALVRRHDSDLVIRFNGGGQAGHNVVTPDDRHHTFSQWGSGTLADGCWTFLSRFTVVHPTAMLIEAERLENVGVTKPFGRLVIDRRALVNTPFHQADNRLEEIWRSVTNQSRHGSVGVGFGSTVRHAIANDKEALRFGDLEDQTTLMKKLRAIQSRMRSLASVLKDDLHITYLDADSIASRMEFSLQQAEELCRCFHILENPEFIERTVSAYSRVYEQVKTVDEDQARRLVLESHNPIFEGAQGVLLDEDYGFHPHTTWSRTTDRNARTLLSEVDTQRIFDVETIGVTRAYMTRHGRGPFPTEINGLKLAESDHNRTNDWQEGFRQGWLDLVLLDYAASCMQYRPDYLAVNHLDQVRAHGTSRAAVAYSLFDMLRTPARPNLMTQEKLGDLISDIEVIYSDSPARWAADADVKYQIATRLQLPIRILGYGPKADDKRFE